jgi:hypothetical protein
MPNFESIKEQMGKLRGLRWALEDEKKFDNLLRHLKDINDGLGSLLLRHTQESVLRSVIADLLASNNSNELGAYAAASSGIYEDLASAARIKNLMVLRSSRSDPAQADASGGQQTQVQIPRGKVDLDATPDMEGGRVRVPGTFRHDSREIRVVIEWKPYNLNWSGDQSASRKRIESLVKVLQQTPRPSGFRVLDCLGYFDDVFQSRFGFVYCRPEWASPLEPPVTLQQLLYSLSDDKKPLLGERFQLARKIATSIHSFQSTDWVHKDVNSSNILFFPDPSTGACPLSLPFVTGFEYSRPDEVGEFTEKPANSDLDLLYRHPDYSGDKGFKRRYDLYSLGIVLFEIGAWSSVQEVRKRTSSIDDYRTILLSKYVPRLGQTVGAIYRDSVLACLSGDLGDGDSQSIEARREFLRAFQWKVVRELEKCVA